MGGAILPRGIQPVNNVFVVLDPGGSSCLSGVFEACTDAESRSKLDSRCCQIVARNACVHLMLVSTSARLRAVSMALESANRTVGVP